MNYKNGNNILFFTIPIILLLLLTACNNEEEDELCCSEYELSNLSEAYTLFSDNVTVYTDGQYVVYETNDLPDHKSPYWLTNNPLYEPYNGNNTNFKINPNRIMQQNIVIKIPAIPSEATNKEPTPLGAIGISRNGVVFYNQYAGPNNTLLTNEINSFDQYFGHPQPQGAYHYHIEPTWLTAQYGRDAFLGFLADGFPVYGPEENGTTINNSNLDDYHGHSHTTTEFPDGIYHYHITDQSPYINGDAFFGIKGSITN
jgi:hypothetical protein